MVITQPSPITIPWNLLIFSKSLMLCLVLENAMKKKKKLGKILFISLDDTKNIQERKYKEKCYGK